MMTKSRIAALQVLVVALILGLAARPATAQWSRAIEIDPPQDIKNDREFAQMLTDQGLRTGGFVNWFTGRWPNISLIGGMAMGNRSEDLEFFFSRPTFKWWTEVLDYVMQDGGDLYGIRATFKPYGNVPPQGGRSYLLTMRIDTLQKDFHPSYILANGRRIWDSRIHPMQSGWICVPFYLEEAGFPVVEFVIDQKYTPEIRGLAFRMFFLQNLGQAGTKVTLKGAADEKIPLPTNLQKFPFGLFPSGYDFYTNSGLQIAAIEKQWKHNGRPSYPVDTLYLCPRIFGQSANGAYHDFMMTYGGCNTTGTNPSRQLVKECEDYLTAVMVPERDVAGAKAALALGDKVVVNWMTGESGVLAEREKAQHVREMARQRREIEADKAATGAPDRVKAIYEPFPPALSAAHEYERGHDILCLKNEEDPQYNILMSMSRGAGRSCGKQFGFYWEQTHYPFPSADEKLHCCMLYYLSGGTWIGAELENMPGFEHGVVPDPVVPWVQAMRFASVHPARGAGIVPVGIFWTYGDKWWVPYNVFGEMDTFQRHVEFDFATRKLTVEPAFTHVFDWMPQDRREWGFQTTGHLRYFIDDLPELQGYDLLDVFFPQYGNAYTARITRLLTGTPYGPVDFVYGDCATAEHLKSFGMLAILGHAELEPAIVQKLQAALESGVPVVLGAQHVKTAGGDLWSLELGPASAAQGKVGGEEFDGRVHSFRGEGWRTVTSVGGRPLLVSKQVGKGTAYVYLGEWMKDGGTALRPLLAELAARAAPLVFNEPEDAIEYVAYKKGQGAWVALLNHGNIVIGCDRLDPGTWRVQPPEPLFTEPKGAYAGTIEFRPDKLGLDPQGDYALYEVIGIDGQAFDKVVAGTETFRIKEIPVQAANGRLATNVTIDKRAEYIIAPQGKGQEVFFAPP